MKRGKKFKSYDIGLDIQNRVEELATQPPRDLDALECSAFGYILALGETLPPESNKIYYKGANETTHNPLSAYLFDKWTDALKWALENCEITETSASVPPRGLERPRYPRVCSLRVYSEVSEL